jgi:hypothetical protein
MTQAMELCSMMAWNLAWRLSAMLSPLQPMNLSPAAKLHRIAQLTAPQLCKAEFYLRVLAPHRETGSGGFWS